MLYKLENHGTCGGGQASCIVERRIALRILSEYFNESGHFMNIGVYRRISDVLLNFRI
jgi:hypothetical protein